MPFIQILDDDGPSWSTVPIVSPLTVSQPASEAHHALKPPHVTRKQKVKRVNTTLPSSFSAPHPRTMSTLSTVVPSTPSRKLTKAQLREPWNNSNWGKTSIKSIMATHKKDVKKTVTFDSPSTMITERKERAMMNSAILLSVTPTTSTATTTTTTSHPPLTETVPPLVVKESKKKKNKKTVKITSSAPIVFTDTYSLISDNPSTLGISSHGTQSSSPDINICTLNVNSISSPKLVSILAFILFMKIDVMVLIDTRHRDCSVKGYNTQIKDLLGSQSRCVHSPIAPHSTKKGFKSSVGGQMIIISHTWAGALIDHFSDPSNLGLVSGITLSTGAGSLLIMGNYWPFPPNKTNNIPNNGLWDRTSNFLNFKKIKKNPKEYIQSLICKQSDRHLGRSSSNTSIACGDFNHRWETGKYQLHDWVLTNNWACPSIEHELPSSPIATYTTNSKPVSWIDHHLIAPASAAHQVLSTTSFDGPFWDDVSDHRPLMIHLVVPGGRGTAGIIRNPYPRVYRPSPRPTVDIKDSVRIKIYQKSLEEYSKSLDPPESAAHAHTNIFNLVSQSVETSTQVFPKKRSHLRLRSSYKDGWSPLAMAIKYQRIAILNILGHLQGTKKRKKWRNLQDQSLGIRDILKTWSKSVNRLKWKPPDTAWGIMNASSFGPLYWSSLTTMADVPTCIEALSKLKHKLHGKQRQLLREGINQAVSFREKMVAEGKIRQYNKAVLRESPTHNPLNSLTTSTGDILEGSLEILQAHTEHYKKAFSTPTSHAGGIHEEGDNEWDWKTGGSKADFLARIEHHSIPDKYKDIIWEAMTTVPQAPPPQEFSTAFDSPPSYKEFCDAISSRSGKSAGGMSGLTYQHMKAWSPDLKTKIYENLIYTWKSNDPPDWWKWRWLCPIPKTADDSKLTGQRPIMLVEVTRKCWVALIIHRITRLWNKHDSLHLSQHGFRAKRGTDTALMGLQAMFEQSALNDSSLFLSSWDISKAFDSLSKNALRFSWTRLGVPPQIADFLVKLDEKGTTIVRTPHSLQVWKKKKHSGFLSGNPKKRKLCFDAARGAGQGDVGSPINWNAAFDILLCALSTAKTDRFYIKG